MNARWSRRAAWALLMLCALASARFRYFADDGIDWRSAINNDGKFYYEYLRMTLFPSRIADRHRGRLRPAVEGGCISHFGGAAAMMAPAVLAAHGLTLLRPDAPEDGYSLHYQVAVGGAALAWLGIGLFALRRLLLDLGHDDEAVAVTLPALTLGTGLITQAVIHPAMSHVYGFAAVALFVSRVSKLLLAPSPPLLIGCAVLLAMAIWVRPVNGLAVLAAPALAMGGAARLAELRNLVFSRMGALSLGAFVIILTLQPLLWWLQTGRLLVEPYPGEGFHWSRPAVLQSWFSARNGLLFYWPVMALPFIGIVRMRRHDRRAAWSLVAFTAAFVYVTASWWNWAYGDNFGQRSYLDALPVFAIALPFALPRRRPWRSAVLLLLALACALNLFQSWQYSRNLLWTGQLHADQYARLFLSSDPQRALELGGHDDMPLFAPRGYTEADSLRSAPADARDREQLIAWAPLPHRPSDPHVRLVVNVVRTSLASDGCRDAWLTIALRSGADRVRLHRFRMDRVPGGAAVRAWEHSYSLRSRSASDTLVILAEGLERCRIDGVVGRLLIRR